MALCIGSWMNECGIGVVQRGHSKAHALVEGNDMSSELGKG